MSCGTSDQRHKPAAHEPAELRSVGLTAMLTLALTAVSLAALPVAAAEAAVTVTVTSVHTDARKVDMLIQSDLGAGELRLERNGVIIGRWGMDASGDAERTATVWAPAVVNSYQAVFTPEGSTVDALSPVLRVLETDHRPAPSKLRLKTDQVMYPGGAIVFRTGARAESVYLKLNGRLVRVRHDPAAKGMFRSKLPLRRGHNYIQTVSKNAWGKVAEKTRRVDYIGKVPAASSYIVIDKSEFLLYLVKKDKLFRRYPIAVGTWVTPTKRGVRILGAKQKSSGAWGPLRMPLYKKTSRGLRNTGYYIHGTNQPASIGTAASHGCVRMYNWHVKSLSKLVRPGLKVLIRD